MVADHLYFYLVKWLETKRNTTRADVIDFIHSHVCSTGTEALWLSISELS